MQLDGETKCDLDILVRFDEKGKGTNQKISFSYISHHFCPNHPTQMSDLVRNSNRFFSYQIIQSKGAVSQPNNAPHEFESILNPIELILHFTNKSS